MNHAYRENWVGEGEGGRGGGEREEGVMHSDKGLGSLTGVLIKSVVGY